MGTLFFSIMRMNPDAYPYCLLVIMGVANRTLRNLIIDKIGVDITIDPDAIARRIDPDS